MTRLLTITSAVLLKNVPKLLREFGYRTFWREATFLYVSGDVPVLLVAHVDTVHKKPPAKVYYDPKERVYWSPDGLGADDRAGVWACLTLAASAPAGGKPHLLFTDLEEIGGVGAKDAARALKGVAREFHIVVEIDRRGRLEAVFYDNGDKNIREYITSLGFEEEHGTFSDISILCPEWGVGGVNLSAGYYNAHTSAEYLVVDDLLTTVELVKKILADPPKERFVYVPSATVWGYDYDDDFFMLEDGKPQPCDFCGKLVKKLYCSLYLGVDLCRDCYESLYGIRVKVGTRRSKKLRLKGGILCESEES